MIFEPNWQTFPKHYSTWLGVAVIVCDSVYLFTDALKGYLTPETVVLINAAIVPLGMKILQLLKQDIPVAPAVKQEMKAVLEVLPTTVSDPLPPNSAAIVKYLDKRMEDRWASFEERFAALTKMVRPFVDTTTPGKVAAQVDLPPSATTPGVTF